MTDQQVINHIARISLRMKTIFRWQYVAYIALESLYEDIRIKKDQYVRLKRLVDTSTMMKHVTDDSK